MGIYSIVNLWNAYDQDPTKIFKTLKFEKRESDWSHRRETEEKLIIEKQMCEQLSGKLNVSFSNIPCHIEFIRKR